MAKKIRSYHKSRFKRREKPRGRTSKDYEQSELENRLLTLLYSADRPLSSADLDAALGPASPGNKGIRASLALLSRDNLVIKDGKKCFLLNKRAPLCEGSLSQHPKGFGFVGLARNQKQKFTIPSRDPFVPMSRMAGAHHGDTVLLRILRTRRDHRPEATVLTILSQASNTIGGIFMEDGGNYFVYPDDRRFPFTIQIDGLGGLRPAQGDGVIAEYQRTGRPSRLLHGKIKEILGAADKIDTQMRLVAKKFDLPRGFSTSVIEETEALALFSSPEDDRVDLRGIDHITIDGEDAKDFDDAIAVVKTPKGFRLYVSIADVSHFVKPGSPIDRDAYRRGTSIYFPGRVIPMLPEKLSNDLCSLVEDKDRLTISAILDFDRTGKRLKKSFCRSIIRSRKRFTYTTVKQIILDMDADVRRDHKPFLTPLTWAYELATALHQQRNRRGSINFNIAEPEFTFSHNGEVESIRRSERNFAHQLIEEFMLAANEAVAELFSEKSQQALYRVHEPPDPLQTEEFTNFARTIEPTLPPFDNHPAWFCEILELFSNTRSEYIINTLLLRSMKQAHYSAKNVGHFGLGATNYTHFTSPIRRYPDLLVHRALLRHLTNSPKEQLPSTLPSLREAGELLSTRERVAIAAERDMHDRLKILYMKEHIGESFEAIISGVTESNLFVEIQEHCISGSLAVELLDDDYYYFDGARHRLFGEITAKTYQLGDPLRVTLTGADMISKKLRFKPASSGS